MPATAPSQFKVVIHAAGKDAITTDGHPLVLQKLGDQSILQCVAQNAEQLASPEDIYIVVGYRQDEVRVQLDSTYQYVVQANPNGTGAAVREVTNRLQGFRGNLLILY